MLSAQENERLTRVGPGTPMGQLMRRYWHPVAAAAELDAHPVKRVKILGESLVVYRDQPRTPGPTKPQPPIKYCTTVELTFGIGEQGQRADTSAYGRARSVLQAAGSTEPEAALKRTSSQYGGPRSGQSAEPAPHPLFMG